MIAAQPHNLNLLTALIKAMAKKSKASISTTKTTTTQSTPSDIQFPDISLKETDQVEVETLLDDQIILLHNVLTAAECKALIKLIESLPLDLTPPKRRGEADRLNYRFSTTSVDFAAKLHALFLPHLPSFPYPARSTRRGTVPADKRLPHSMNSNIRLYKYTLDQHFGCHYDDSVRDLVTGVQSEWTLLVYLSGVQDGVEGGETLFHQDHKGKPRESITAPLMRGTALLHRHGADCLLHEGSVVKKGIKYVLRSDLMFL